MHRPHFLARAVSSRTALAVAVLAASSFASVASAVQDAADSGVPPQPEKGLALISPVLGYLVMAISTAATVSVSLLPAKRGHQD